MTRSGRTLAQTIEEVASGRIGHREAMNRPGFATYLDLLDTMRVNGRSIWAHRVVALDDEPLGLLRIGCGRQVDGEN